MTFKDSFKTNAHWARYITNTFKYKYNWAVGAYRSSKSISNLVAFAMNLETTPDKLHLVIASTVSSARNIFEDADGNLGLKQYFGVRYKQTTYKGSDAGIIKTPTGEKIVVYLGGSMESSYKQFRGWSCGMIVLEEANLLHPNTIQEAKGRTLLAKKPKYFISMNPTSPRASIYNWLHELQDKNLVNYDRSTIYDNPALTPERRDEIISEFDPDSLFYQQYILGKDVEAAGAAFRLRDYNYLDKPKESYKEIYIVMDTGETRSATGIIAIGVYFDIPTAKFNIDIIDEYYWLNNEHKGHEKMFPDTAQDLANFIKNIQSVYHLYPNNVIIDESPEMYRNVLLKFRENTLPTQNIRYPIKDSDEERVKRIETLLYQGRLKICKACTHTITSIQDALFDSKYMEVHGTIRLLSNYNDEGHSDLLDCISYGTKWLGNKLYV